MKLVKALLVLTALTSSNITSAQEIFNTSQGDFKNLFNSYRVAQPKNIPWAGDFFPFGTKGTAIKLDREGKPHARGRSPMEAYGKIMGIGSEAEDWEAEVHNCSHLDSKTKKSCEAWWGHCNGWSAAAIKEAEPREIKNVNGENLSVAEQKAILTELWLSSYSINAGDTDKNIKTKSWVHEHRAQNKSFSYSSFWDISPRTFFLALTNQIGAMKTGFVIDRFTGDEVWNQPLVGYRLMPILASDIKQVSDQGERYWAVKMGLKFYWANDLGTSPGHLSAPFNIHTMTKDERGLFNLTSELEYLTEDYEGRYLEFTLYFDDEVQVSPDGKSVLKAGDFLGEGIWEHQERSTKYRLDQLDHSHPDFIWVPTNPYQDASGYGNPHLDASISAMISEGRVAARPVIQKIHKTLVFKKSNFSTQDLSSESVRAEIKKILLRESIRSLIKNSDVEITSSEVIVKILFYNADAVNSISDLFSAGQLPFKFKE